MQHTPSTSRLNNNGSCLTSRGALHRLVKDRETGRSRGFGFVDMPVEAEALTAINALNGKDVGGRPLRVIEARPKEERPPRPAGAGGPGGGGNRGHGGGGGRRDPRDGWDRDKRS